MLLKEIQTCMVTSVASELPVERYFSWPEALDDLWLNIVLSLYIKDAACVGLWGRLPLFMSFGRWLARLRPYTIPAAYLDIPPLRGAEDFALRALCGKGLGLLVLQSCLRVYFRQWLDWSAASKQDALLAFLGPEVSKLVFNFLSQAFKTKPENRGSSAVHNLQRWNSFLAPAELSGRHARARLSLENFCQ